MKTGGVSFNRGFYDFVSSNPDKTTLNYKVRDPETVNKQPLFTEIVRFQYDNGFHDRSREFDYWLYFRNDTNWKRCKKTGIAKTNFKNIFEGNISRELLLTAKREKGKNFETAQHLVIIQSIDIKRYLIIDIFENFYICNPKILNLFLKDHLEIKKEPVNSSLVCSNINTSQSIIKQR